ncbi:MAG: hypothetical protein QXL81_01475, partial [Candidatus Aenigmatarchaeota archaeon]
QKMIMEISAQITGIKYKPLLCRELRTYSIKELERALSMDATFLLYMNGHKLAVSHWVSAKRTRSYPYARVYDSLAFAGKKVTIIPILKDEGFGGDRDYLQWDTISLMSLIGVYVIVSYYASASPNPRFSDKITEQRFDSSQIKEQLHALLSYQSDALHWNLLQVDKAHELLHKALDAYDKISKKLKIRVHSREAAEKRLQELIKGKESFMRLSRMLAQRARDRESVTIQPKEKLVGKKAALIIKNHLGGCYFFTADEACLKGKNVFLIESKHTVGKGLPALEDIKDGLFKMILFTNFSNTTIGNRKVRCIPILKLTTKGKFKIADLSKKEKKTLALLKKESKINGFRLMANEVILRS